MFDLSGFKLLITLEATEAMALDRYAGSSLRGAIYEALLRRFCVRPQTPTCMCCPLNATCPVAGLVAPLRDEHPRGRDAPRPFVIAADPMAALSYGEDRSGAAVESHGSEEATAGAASRAEIRLEAGQTYTFAVTLFGNAVRYFPYLALSLPTVAALGIGRPLREHRGRRGRPQIARIEAVQPFSGEREALYRAGEQAAEAPTLAITRTVVAARAAALPSDRLSVRFITPTRLVGAGRLLARPDARTLILRLGERLEALEQAYGQPYGQAPGRMYVLEDGEGEAAHERRRERYLALERLARDIQVVEDETRWVEVTSYSSRQRQSMPIGGFVGQATLEGDLGPLRELLVWGEVAHVGKNAVKGDGCLQVRLAPAPPSSHRDGRAAMRADSAAARQKVVEKTEVVEIALGI
ncbi:MAG: CRISPR system precrRNA processing endoribonuclease RAMP protein Cas6 [Ktedonobacterales bacterium]